MEKEIVLLSTILVLDMMAVGLVVPLMPYYALDKVGMGQEYYGLLGTTYQAAQLIGAIIIGSLSDTLGKKFGLLLSFIGSAVSYLMLGYGNSIWIIFLSRFIVGIVKQTIAIATSIIADLPTTNEENMAKRIGKLNSFMGMGFIVGPICGGMLSSISYELPTLISASVFGVCSILTILYLPSPPPSPNSEKLKKNKSGFNFSELTAAIFNRSTGRWIVMMAILCFSFSLVRSTFSILMKEKYELSAQQNGFFMAYIGVSSALTQAFGVPFSARIKKKNTRMIAGCLLLIFGFFSEVYSHLLWLSLFSIGIIIFGAGILTTTITASFSQLLPKGKTGGGLGVFNATQNAVGVVAPAIAGYVAKGDISIPFALSGSVVIGLLAIIVAFPAPETVVKPEEVAEVEVTDSNKKN